MKNEKKINLEEHEDRVNGFVALIADNSNLLDLEELKNIRVFLSSSHLENLSHSFDILSLNNIKCPCGCGVAYFEWVEFDCEQIITSFLDCPIGVSDKIPEGSTDILIQKNLFFKEQDERALKAHLN